MKSWWAPIFCRRQYFVTLLHGGPVQMSRYSVGESPPIKGVANCNQSLDDRMRWQQHLQGERHQRGLEKASYCGLFQAKTVRRCSAELVHNLRMRQHFVRRLYFVNANILLMPVFCRRQYLVDAYILSMPIFFRRQYFVDANILSTPIFGRRQYFVDTDI